MVVLAHFVKEELLELIWIKLERKKRRKGLVMVVRRSEVAT